MYKVIKSFYIDVWDNNYETREIKEGSKWEKVDSKYINAEVRLECVDNLDWLEISKEVLKEHFEKAEVV